MLINNDINLIPTTKVYAPQITKEDFVEHIITYLQTVASESSYVHTFSEMKQSLIDNTGNLTLSNDALGGIKDYDNIICGQDSIISMSTEINNSNLNNILGIHITKKGIPFWGVLMNYNDYIEMFRVIYFNGNNLEMYTPHYGNAANFDENEGLSCFDSEEDDDYFSKFNTDSKTVLNARLEELIDETAILQEIETVFVVGMAQNTNNNSSSSNNGNSGNNNTSSYVPQKTVMDVLYEVFSKKMYDLIPGLQQSLVQQGTQPYDKVQCFKDLKNKDIFQKDIFNFIIQFNNHQNDNAKCIECNKIATYIKKFKYYHEGLII